MMGDDRSLTGSVGSLSCLSRVGVEAQEACVMKASFDKLRGHVIVS